MNSSLLAPQFASEFGRNSALLVFVLYIAAVMFLAWMSSRLSQRTSFVSEYFLGSRGLGLWAFAMTFAATSSSGGSFIGFPSIVYNHGWVVALWIASYMATPLVAMGMLGKRINSTARKTGAITIPDLIRDRFESPLLGTVATLLILFFLIFNLVAQFKGGSIILQTLLEDVPIFQQTSLRLAEGLQGIPLLGDSSNKPGYLLCLLVFSGVVIIYTAYGGFRAVVWTDVMQGIVMVAGVMIMLPLTLWAVGGLRSATEEMSRMTPPRWVMLKLSLTSPSGPTPLSNIALSSAAAGALHPATASAMEVPQNSWLVMEEGERRRVFRTANRAMLTSGESSAASSSSDSLTATVPAIELTYQPHVLRQTPTVLAAPIDVQVLESTPYQYGDGMAGVYVSGPGPDAKKASGFMPISLAVSFFFMWTFSGAGQPSSMVRLMAFNHSDTLRRAIFTVSIYYSMIYFSLVVIFCCARVLLPGWETESDRIMPEMARVTTAIAGTPWLAGLILAAPFAAVMSTVDSFLLMISSAIVRDIYVRKINAQASEKNIKRLTHLVTIFIGGLAMLAAISPPQLLQDIIVFTGSGLSSSFLFPVTLMLYWPRFNHQGALAGMLGGFLCYSSLYLAGTLAHPQKMMTAFEPWGFHPFLIGSLASLLVSLVVTLWTQPPPGPLVKRYFGRSD